MQVAATKAMARELNARSPYTITWEKMSERTYHWEVSIDCYGYDHDNDYLYNSDMYRVIKVTYPDSYYACPKYATTRELLRIFRENHIKTIEDFCAAFNDEYEI